MLYPAANRRRRSQPNASLLAKGREASEFPAPARIFAATWAATSVIGPGLSKLDLSVFKNNYIRRISESFNAQFRAEIFNIFNRANFGSPTDNLTVFDQNGQPIQSAGLLDSTQTTSRQIQFALKLIW